MKYEHEIGGDGGKVEVGIEGGMIYEKVTFPVVKFAEPLTKVVDSVIDAVEKAVPGDWDKALLEPIRAMAKAEIAKMIGG